MKPKNPAIARAALQAKIAAALRSDSKAKPALLATSMSTLAARQPSTTPSKKATKK